MSGSDLPTDKKENFRGVIVMKKLLSAIMVMAMVATLFIPTVSAADERMFVNVRKIGDGQIVIDGNVTAAEWDETNKITLSMKEGSSPMMTSWVGENKDFLDIEFYYCWSDAGIYMAAKINDNCLKAAADATSIDRTTDHFQISFNPAGIIDDKYEGMFFSFLPVEMAEGETVGTVKALRHNITGGRGAEDDQPTLIEASDETYEAKYTLTANGWQLEMLLPWKYVAADSRTWELEYVDDMDCNNVLLTNFDPNDTNRKRAYADVLIAFVDYDEAGISVAAGSFLTNNKDNWHVDNYGIRLKFRNTDEVNATDTEVQSWTRTDEGVKLNEYGTLPGGQTEDTGDIPEGNEGNETSTDESGDANTDTAAAGTTADGTVATTDGENNGKKDGNDINIGVIIAIVAAVVVIGGVVAVVVVKKKKN